jgi:hypothetical protein
MSSGFVVVDQGGIDVAVPADLDTFERKLLELVDNVRTHLSLMIEYDSPELVLRFISLPSFTGRVAILEIEGLSTQDWLDEPSTVVVALRDRTRWEVVAPMEKWPVRGPRAVAAMDAFLKFHDSIPAFCQQILWLVEAAWGHWSTARGFPQYGDRYWILQEPVPGGDPVTNLVAGRAREALDAMIEANDLKNAATSYRSVKVGRRQAGVRTPQVNRGGVLMPKVAGLTAIERHQLQIIERAKRMLKNFGDDVALIYYPSAIDTHDCPDPMLEVEFMGNVVMALRLVGGKRWEPVRGFLAYTVKNYVEGDNYNPFDIGDLIDEWCFHDSPLVLLIQVFFLFQPDCDSDTSAKYVSSPTAGRVARKCAELSEIPAEDRSINASAAVAFWNLVQLADEQEEQSLQEWLDEHERPDPFDGCVGDGDCPAGCWYCDDYKDRHRAGECGGHCFLC